MFRIKVLPLATVVFMFLASVSLVAAAGDDAALRAPPAAKEVLPAYLQGSGPLTAAQRSRAARDFVNRWGGYFRQVYSQPIDRWAVKQGQVIGRADPDNIRSAMSHTTFEAAMMTLRGQAISDEEAIDYMATLALRSSTTPMALGDLAKDLVFVPLPPCRILDTRSTGTVISSGATRSFDIFPFSGTNFAYQGGTAAGNCGMDPSAAAVVLNIAAPLPTTGGFLTVYPFGTTRPLASNLDYFAGELKNNEIVAKSANSTFDITVYAHGTTHVVGDVVGYFIAPQATALECVTTVGTTAILGPGSAQGLFSPVCPTGYTQTSTNCESSIFEMSIVGFSGGICNAKNNSALSNGTLQASRTCCRTPGR